MRWRPAMPGSSRRHRAECEAYCRRRAWPPRSGKMSARPMRPGASSGVAVGGFEVVESLFHACASIPVRRRRLPRRRDSLDRRRHNPPINVDRLAGADVGQQFMEAALRAGASGQKDWVFSEPACAASWSAWSAPRSSRRMPGAATPAPIARHDRRGAAGRACRRRSRWSRSGDIRSDMWCSLVRSGSRARSVSER